MSNYIDFAEEKLELGYDYGAIGGMRFNTTIIKDGEKNEQRNSDWWLPLGRWQLGERTLLESDSEQIKELEYLRGFHQNRKGSKQGFRFKDWSDYQGDNVIGIGDGNRTQWQLVKIYFVNDHVTYRPITKPVEETVKVFVGGFETFTSWSMDYATGILTFETAPEPDAQIICRFEFDVPVWFETDEFSYTLEGYQKDPGTGDVNAIYRLGNLAVQEGRLPLSLPYEYLLPIPQKLAPILDLGIIDNTLAKDKFDTSKESINSGYVRRDSNIQEAESYLEISKNWNQEELDNLLNYFWNCRGKAVTFNLALNGERYKVRFKEDNLNIKFLVYDRATGDSIYAIANLGFYVFNQLAPAPALPAFTIGEPNYIDYGLNFSEEVIEVPRNFTPSVDTEDSDSDDRSNSTNNDSESRTSFGGSSSQAPIELPEGFRPRLIGEISEAPVILGTLNFNELYLAIPSLPYNGSFTLYALGYGFIGLPELFLYRNGALHTIITARPEGDTTNIRIELCLEVFADLSWQLTELTSNTQSSGSFSRNFYSSTSTLSFSNNTFTQYITGNLPSSINVEFNLYNSGGSKILNELTRSIPPYEKNRTNDLGDRFIEGAIYFDSIARKIYEIKNDAPVVILDLSDTPFLLVNRMAGGMDAAGNIGFILTDLRLCDDEINRGNLAACSDGSIVPHVGLFEKLSGETKLTWVGSTTAANVVGNSPNIHRSVYFKRVVITNGYIIHLPTGIVAPISELGFSKPADGLINAGQNYLVVLTSAGTEWNLFFINFHTGISR